jgi:pilus assembly protein CpaE
MSASVFRAVVVDSDPDTRAAVRRVLGGLPGVAVVGEYSHAGEAALQAPASRPDVMIVEVSVDSDADNATSAATVAGLARRLPDTALLATAANGSPEFVLQILRAGALELVRRPIEQRELLAALDKVARLRGRPVQRQAGRVTAVFSTKGGLGTTTLAVNLAVCLTEHSAVKSALLVELGTAPSDVVTFLDLQPRYSIVDVLESIDRMDESLLQGLMTKHGSGLWVLPSPPQIDRGHLVRERVHAGIELVRMHFDHVVLDLGHDMEPGTVAALETSDTVLYVTTLNVAALRSAAAGLTAFRHQGFDLKKVKVVIARDGTSEDVTATHAREALGMPVYWKTPNDYAAAEASINGGNPVVTTSPRSRLSKNVRQLSETLLGAGQKSATSLSQRSAALLAAAWPINRLSGVS